jgi:hypothetical protein
MELRWRWASVPSGLGSTPHPPGASLRSGACRAHVTGKLLFIEVKGRVSGADTITATRNAILYSLNKPDDFILAIVEFMPDDTHRLHYVRHPFHREPDFGVTSVNYDFRELLARGEAPA